MATLRFLLPALVLFAACEKKSKKPPVVQNNQTQNTQPDQVTPKPKPAPTGVPAALKSMLDAKWPKLEAEGQKFNAKFMEAQKLRGNRAALTKKIEEARQHYTTMKDIWAEIAYWPVNQLDDGNIDQKTHDLCERYLRSKSSVVKGWDKKAKSLKELSAVK